MTDRYASLSPEAQRLLRNRLNARDDTTLTEVVSARNLDQVDIVLILLDAELRDDVAHLTGVRVAHYPPPEHLDPWCIDNWRTANYHPRTGPAGTPVRQLVAHGMTHEHIDQLQASGAIRLEPYFPPGPRDESLEERAQWLRDYIARHPNPNDIDNWRVTHVGVPTRTDHRPLTQFIRLGMTVRQLITRGVSYPLLDGALRSGWLRIEPRTAA